MRVPVVVPKHGSALGSDFHEHRQLALPHLALEVRAVRYLGFRWGPCRFEPWVKADQQTAPDLDGQSFP